MRYPHVITVYPLELDTGKGKLGTSYTLEAFVQPLNTGDAIIADGIFAKDLKCYVPDGSTISKSDIIGYRGGKYKVKDVSFFYGSMGLDHVKLILTAVNQ